MGLRTDCSWFCECEDAHLPVDVGLWVLRRCGLGGLRRRFGLVRDAGRQIAARWRLGLAVPCCGEVLACCCDAHKAEELLGVQVESQGLGTSHTQIAFDKAQHMPWVAVRLAYGGECCSVETLLNEAHEGFRVAE
jgi:hypothetical protein